MSELFQSEHAFNYDTYTFGYARYARRTNNESLSNLYEQGHLPYSGSSAKGNDPIWYMARSLRVAREGFIITSENRRILKKFNQQDFRIQEIYGKDYIPQKEGIEFCLHYFSEKHGEGIMSEERLRLILQFVPEVWVVEYRNKTNKLVAVIIDIREESLRHYWFSCYALDEEYKSLGGWLLLSWIMLSFESGVKSCYLGTCYGAKSLYKTNIERTEYWDGNVWNGDMQKLCQLVKTDDQRIVTAVDVWKNQQE